jgi:hypothetical protein
MSDKCIYYAEGYKYQVKRDFTVDTEIRNYDIETDWCRLTPDGKLTAKRGYAFDGASGPTWDTKNSMRGAATHDLCYQLIRLGMIDRKYKEYADKLLHDLCTEDGMWSWRADYWRWAVLKFGAGSCRPSAEPQELVAP